MAELYTDTGCVFDFEYAVKTSYFKNELLVRPHMVVGNVDITEKGRTNLMQMFGIQRDRLRVAKRTNRLRRIARCKAGKTYHGTIKKIVRRYNKIIKTPLIYCSTETCLQEMSITEAAKRLMLADPSPSVPVLFVMDESDAEEWQKASNLQRPEEWNKGGDEWQK